MIGVEKFNYLCVQFDGEASSTVSEFTLTDANYEQSVSLLESELERNNESLTLICKLC